MSTIFTKNVNMFDTICLTNNYIFHIIIGMNDSLTLPIADIPTKFEIFWEIMIMFWNVSPLLLIFIAYFTLASLVKLILKDML